MKVKKIKLTLMDEKERTVYSNEMTVPKMSNQKSGVKIIMEILNEALNNEMRLWRR